MLVLEPNMKLGFSTYCTSPDTSRFQLLRMRRTAARRRGCRFAVRRACTPPRGSAAPAGLARAERHRFGIEAACRHQLAVQQDGGGGHAQRQLGTPWRCSSAAFTAASNGRWTTRPALSPRDWLTSGAA
jgi:hypothetical protein